MIRKYNIIKKKKVIQENIHKFHDDIIETIFISSKLKKKKQYRFRYRIREVIIWWLFYPTPQVLKRNTRSHENFDELDDN